MLFLGSLLLIARCI